VNSNVQYEHRDSPVSYVFIILYSLAKTAVCALSFVFGRDVQARGVR
jgi:hypothetical protein